ncbi:amidohydrolase family protein [Neisseria sp. ZJ106]|uniref:Amidohydrolase family protein n=1 Tax=Neisseria lisongii TaxID=2912188 RepID=A0ABY7RIQ3_9NEIS|nr:amidohydrolase family protein [Neisseria lisongii]MCF7520539.1 amidohydrolase family protein [Neisseria lisongii]WCL71522.1 amidohydrolase family protein [Neisseria lisongii]
MYTVDTHAHIFNQHDDFIEHARYTPSYTASVAEFLDRLDTHQLHYGVLIQPSFYGTDNSAMLQAVAEAKGRLKAVIVVDPDISAQELQQYCQQGVCGIRLNLFGQPIPDVDTPQWEKLTQILKTLGWHIELHCPPGYLLVLLPAFKRHGVDIVIDHLGRPAYGQDLDGEVFQQFISLLDPKYHWIKLSGLYRLACADNAVECGRQIYEMLKAQGMLSRIVWGSDWPHTQHEHETDYSQNWQLLHEIVQDENERRQILSTNPCKLFGF